jgi:hypothetical protein
MKYLAILLLLVLPAEASKRCATCPRDSRGKIQRSYHAKHEFRKSNPCPATGKTTGKCRGYVIDHVKPLECGGADSKGNMQWQSRGDAAQKDKTEGSCLP